MKKLIYIPLLLLLFSACDTNSSSSYSSLLSEEKETIANFIKRNNINVLQEMPADGHWGENDYYEVEGYDNLYFHLVEKGDTIQVIGNETIEIEPIKATEMVVMRYRQYTLTQYSDTASFWNTLDSTYPTEFRYLTDYTTASTAWHVAVSLMKYSGSECKIICPSKLGLSAEQSSVTPYGYDLRMKIKR